MDHLFLVSRSRGTPAAGGIVTEARGSRDEGEAASSRLAPTERAFGMWMTRHSLQSGGPDEQASLLLVLRRLRGGGGNS